VVFSQHAAFTSKVEVERDKMAVLDSRARVKGVELSMRVRFPPCPMGVRRVLFVSFYSLFFHK
jgi:hypothetical protein